MLAYDFVRTQSDRFDIIAVDRDICDITSFESIVQCIALHEPDILLNCAAYTAVDDAEDVGMQACYEINALGVKNLAKATAVFGVECITISTDYVFDGKKSEGYLPSDACHPISAYGMSKYLGERLALDENPRMIIVRTSWLYGGIRGDQFKNFVNTMLRLSETRSELRVVSDQYGIPTSCEDLSVALAELIENLDQREYAGQIFHFSNSLELSHVPASWADFAREIFVLSGIKTTVIECNSSEYTTKATRPHSSVLINTSDIHLPDWRD
jgi:dTDP-4-dehydrorhamnose reductase